MPARPAFPDCHVRLPGEPHLPIAGTKDYRAAPVSSLVSWRVVAAAGGMAWLLVAGLTLTVWATNNRLNPARASTPVPRNDLSETTAVGDATNLIEPIAKALEPVAASPGAKAPLEQPVSFQKAPASPPLPAEEERVTKEPGLPASELGLGEETANCRNYGTQVAFVSSPTEASRKALKERKLLFVLHLAGNFEDKKFT